MIKKAVEKYESFFHSFFILFIDVTIDITAEFCYIKCNKISYIIRRRGQILR